MIKLKFVHTLNGSVEESISLVEQVTMGSEMLL